jgi:glycosyltransferase involved in cell wall biosynthesis
MKILHIIPNLKKGGAERLVLDICNSLKKIQGIKVKLITFEDENQYEYLTTDLDHSVISASVKLSVKGKNKIKVDALQKEINSFKPDIIHTHLFEAEIVSRSCLYSRAKWFSHCHNNMEQFNNFSKQTLVQKTFFTNYIEKKYLFNRYLANGGNHFIAISNNTRTFYKKTAREFPITLLPNAIDYDRFYNPNVDEKNKKSLTLINVGSLLKNKNQIFLFEIIKILIKTNISVELILLGEGENRHQLESGIKKYRLENQIKLLGTVDNVEDYLNKADMYVHSAISEAMGLTILEAMAAGLPVITLDGKGNRDLIEEGKNGYMIYEQNAELFAQTIIDLWNDKQKYREMSEYAQEFAKQYDIKPYVEKLILLYKNEKECKK